MSADTTARATARATQSVIKGTRARLAGKERGRDRRVRRQSYDVDDPRAKVFRAVNGGSKRGGLRWRDCLIRTAKEYDVWGKKPRQRGGPLGPYAIRVFEELLALLDFATGRLDPTIARIMARTAYCKQTVVAALARLRAHGFLRWVRRSRRVETDAGPVRKQTSNGYHFELSRLPARVWRRFRDLLARRELAAKGEAPPVPTPTRPSAGLTASLAGLETALDARLGPNPSL